MSNTQQTYIFQDVRIRQGISLCVPRSGASAQILQASDMQEREVTLSHTSTGREYFLSK